MRISVTVDTSRVSAAFGRLEREAGVRVRRAVLGSALNIQAEAKRRCPVDTGRLRNSIAYELEAGGLGARVGTNVHYAPFVEFGTRFMPAQPFLFPAFEMERQRFIDNLRRALRSAGDAAAD